MSELSRPIPVDRLRSAPSTHTVEAGPDELGPLAARLMIPAARALRCDFRLRPVTGGVIEAEGELTAEVVQTCVLTLEDFAQPVREAFRVVFVPAGQETDDSDPEAPDQIPYAGGVIDLGEAAAEQLALALDPYPKKPGAAVPAAGDAPDGGPFAALRQRSRPQ